MKIFENVASLKAATLRPNQLVETKGRTTAADGGQARYLIKPPETVDEQIDHTLADGNVAIRVSMMTYGTGSPEGVEYGRVGMLYTDLSGGAGQVLYVKESGSDNVGWIAK